MPAQRLHRVAFILLLASLLGGCTDSDWYKQQVAKQKQAQDPYAHLPNNPPAEGSCVGWQRNLAHGVQIYEIESCLYQQLREDRTAAIADANALSAWHIRSQPGSELKALIATLVQFPQPGSLQAYLNELGLLPNPPGEYNDLNNAVTAIDYLREMGNSVWFDAETGVYPNQHDYLMASIVDSTDLAATEFSETPPGLDASYDVPYQLEASINGKTYQQEARNLGDWYDLEAVLTLLNQLAVDQDSQYRFVLLPTGDQTAIVWAANADALNTLLAKQLIELSPAELSLATGKAFEQAVQTQYGAVE
ncbi:hypothetical protein CHH28_02580 [Bacterioplanes sanyensis]|uniref:Uncharacterized protein n=1 Tax=Bacterioplanes sanyensis TaxID=1249553 RepID=A0A222FG65_9GAMM|nr:hypothetical protein [Bacterioplanes sanyensis]ASP37622.1 hypothetical protein CHH28_02580 [Bacterioplanes sanyensis]